MVAFTILYYAAASRAVVPHFKVPLVRNGTAYEVRLGDHLTVWKAGNRVCNYEGKLLGAWRLEVGDIDRDGSPEILVGVKKKTWNLHFPHQTIFVLGFDGHRVTRKWTGSTMGRPLVDFCVARGNLYTLERRMDGQSELCVNHWNGFGFKKGQRLGNWKEAKALKFVKDRLELETGGGIYRKMVSIEVKE